VRHCGGHNGAVNGVPVSDEIVGVCQSLIGGGWIWPVHGLRHPPKQQTSGWYVWTGEASDAGTFFRPLHASHLVERCPQIKKHLRLPPGSRFLIAPGYEDVWFDPALLDI
jgi:hypothetical protein